MDRDQSPARLCGRLWRRSGGIPLLVIELARHADLSADAPLGARAGLEARLAALPTEARRLIQVVSLGIGPLDHDVVAAVLDLDDRAVIDAARTARDAGVITVTTDGYTPVHDLFREVASDTLLDPERVVLHRRIARLLEAGGDPTHDPIELAHHWVGAGDGQRALRPYVEAARRATRQGADNEAWRRWKVVADILTDPPPWADVVELLADAAEAAHVADRQDAALSLLDWAERALTPPPSAAPPPPATPPPGPGGAGPQGQVQVQPDGVGAAGLGQAQHVVAGGVAEPAAVHVGQASALLAGQERQSPKRCQPR